ncbi:MAG: DUF4383 domain-containing protein [Candidatus Levyibacteriota bacterium]
MQKTITLIFAIFFAVIGVAAFVPALAPVNADGQLLLYIFQVNTTQNYIHLLTALVAFVAFFGGAYYTKNYLVVFGLVYALVALWGLPGLMSTYDGVLFGLIHVNLATELLHIAIAVVALYGGFAKVKASK